MVGTENLHTHQYNSRLCVSACMCVYIHWLIFIQTNNEGDQQKSIAAKNIRRELNGTQPSRPTVHSVEYGAKYYYMYVPSHETHWAYCYCFRSQYSAVVPRLKMPMNHLLCQSLCRLLLYRDAIDFRIASTNRRASRYFVHNYRNFLFCSDFSAFGCVRHPSWWLYVRGETNFPILGWDGWVRIREKCSNCALNIGYEEWNVASIRWKSLRKLRSCKCDVLPVLLELAQNAFCCFPPHPHDDVPGMRVCFSTWLMIAWSSRAIRKSNWKYIAISMA